MSRVIHKFTSRIPTWRPHVTPIDYDNANEAQREALKETPSNTKISDYVLVLAHDPESLRIRTSLFNGIMYDKGGLSRQERELGAVAASVVNRCIYCAAVHAHRYNNIVGSEAVMKDIFLRGKDAELDERTRAILRFGMRLSETPPQVDQDDIQRLRDVGLDDQEILDLTLSTTLFGWANRLMHTLGEPVSGT
ncbi:MULTISPECIES: peroxidase-related enzyme [unclassified Halomonas]|uniref:peroxidase-related enzyme n=1 Tax=unclassified Halomonas TaxID=2609666 RepID=UPI00209FA5F2|nr:MULTISPECIES: peroxidase-related enzyme [unclassified Halomonas]MCP1313890.1 peroxidase-related enzyme [Halomonas sp. 707D7]MCP1327265.1 peroxidase-related enzyme [Halomonas sp. 707D4]